MKKMIFTAAAIVFGSVGFAQTTSPSATVNAPSAEVQKVETRKAAPVKGGCCSMAEGKAGCADKSAKSCAPQSKGTASEKPAAKSEAKAKTES